MILAAVAAEVAQFVELGVEAGADRAAVGQVERRLVGDGLQDAVAHFGDLIQTVVQVAQARRTLRFERALSAPGIFSSERPSASKSRGPAVPMRDLGQQALEIENAAQLLAQFGAQDGLLQQLAYRVQAAFDLRAVERRTQQALAQQASAHAGRGLIEDAAAAWRRCRSPANSGSTSSRLRTVTASSTMVSARS